LKFIENSWNLRQHVIQSGNSAIKSSLHNLGQRDRFVLNGKPIIWPQIQVFILKTDSGIYTKMTYWLKQMADFNRKLFKLFASKILQHYSPVKQLGYVSVFSNSTAFQFNILLKKLQYETNSILLILSLNHEQQHFIKMGK
jgi:hypothetical protein